ASGCQYFISAERFYLGSANRRNPERLADCVEEFEHTAFLAAVGVGDEVDQRGDITRLDAELGQRAFEHYAVVPGQLHVGFSLRGLSVTRCTLPSACLRIQMVVTANDR